MTNVEELLLQEQASVYEALILLDKTGHRFLFIVDKDGRLTGVLTDGDIRRGLLRGHDIHTAVAQFTHKKFVSLPVEATDREISEALCGNISFIPLLDKEGRPVDYSSLQHHRKYPVSQPLLDGNEETYVTECIRTGWVSSRGRFVTEFEHLLANFHGASRALAVSNGTVALQLALAALGIGPGDEVIVPALTFAATASAVIHVGATPVFADVDPVTWVMGVEHIASVLTERTRAVIPVHLYGYPCPMPEIFVLAKERNLKVIEDAAEAFGASVNEQIVGSFGDAACFSFYGNKTITTGEGGAILFKDPHLFARAKMLRDHGMSATLRYWHLEPGFNFRMTNLQAAVGVAQMERIDAILEKKQLILDFYTERFGGLKEFVQQQACPGGKPSCWLYTLQLSEYAGIDRDEFAARLIRNGIETRPTFYPLHTMPAFERYAGKGSFPVAEHIAARGLSFPSAATLTEQELDNICAVSQSILRMRRMVSSNAR
jgi:perosamine synthetase